jgi:hypothetical protein
LKQRHLGLVSEATHGFVPIAFDRYVDLHMQSNPSVDRAEFPGRLRQAVDARRVGVRCACGAFIWAIDPPKSGPRALPPSQEKRGRTAITRSTRPWVSTD